VKTVMAAEQGSTLGMHNAAFMLQKGLGYDGQDRHALAYELLLRAADAEPLYGDGLVDAALLLFNGDRCAEQLAIINSQCMFRYWRPCDFVSLHQPLAYPPLRTLLLSALESGKFGVLTQQHCAAAQYSPYGVGTNA
jgi:hypothetical protein